MLSSSSRAWPRDSLPGRSLRDFRCLHEHLRPANHQEKWRDSGPIRSQEGSVQYTESQIREFQRQFAQRRTRQWLATLPVIAATILIIVSDRLNKPLLGIPPTVIAI